MSPVHDKPPTRRKEVNVACVKGFALLHILFGLFLVPCPLDGSIAEAGGRVRSHAVQTVQDPWQERTSTFLRHDAGSQGSSHPDY